MTLRVLGAVAAAVVVLVTGCSSTEVERPVVPAVAQEAMLRDHGLDGLDAREIVDHLEGLEPGERPADLLASVHPRSLELSDGEGTVSLALPDDSSYVSVAPYLTRTHDCHFHSLTTCQGELAGQEVQVRVTDGTTGDVLVDGVRETSANGFVGLWVPRGSAGTVEIAFEGLSGQAEFDTGTDDGATCLTTLQLT